MVLGRDTQNLLEISMDLKEKVQDFIKENKLIALEKLHCSNDISKLGKFAHISTYENVVEEDIAGIGVVPTWRRWRRYETTFAPL